MPIDIITRLNWIDILVIIIVLRITYVSFQDGLSHEIFPLIGTAGTAVISLHYYHNIAVIMHRGAAVLPIKLLDFLSFVLLLVGVGLIFKLLRVISDKIIKVTWHPLVEKAGGLIVGFLRASVVVSVILMILALMPIPYLQHSIRDKSLIGMHFLRIVPNMYGKVSGVLPTIKIETGSADREDIVKEIVADKSIEQSKKP